jgi:hypothetical protein
MTRSSLQSKIAVAMWGMTVLCTLTISVLSAVLLIRSHQESIRNQLEASATSLTALGISDFSELKDFDTLNIFVEDTLEMEKVDKIVRIYDASGKLIFTTVGLDYDLLPDQLDRKIDKPVFMTIGGKQRRYESLVVPYFGRGKKNPFYLQVVIPLPRYSQIFKSLWWQDLLLLVIFVGASYLLSRQLSKRLLIGRYIAHELRTPLTILQGEAETALAKTDATKEDYGTVLKSSLDEIQRMSEIVNTVLQIGGWERSSSRPVAVDLIGWIRENLPRWEKTLGRPILLALPKREEVRPEVKIEPRLLYQLIDNVIRNVRDHTPPHASCLLAVGGSDPQFFIRVSDDGPGLTPTLLESLNRKSSAGLGIGLNLCLKIAEGCGIKLRFSNQMTGGLLVEIGLPA